MTNLNTTAEILAEIKYLEEAALRAYESRLFDPTVDDDDDRLRATMERLNRMITGTPTAETLRGFDPDRFKQLAQQAIDEYQEFFCRREQRIRNDSLIQEYGSEAEVPKRSILLRKLPNEETPRNLSYLFLDEYGNELELVDVLKRFICGWEQRHLSFGREQLREIAGVFYLNPRVFRVLIQNDAELGPQFEPIWRSVKPSAKKPK